MRYIIFSKEHVFSGFSDRLDEGSEISFYEVDEDTFSLLYQHLLQSNLLELENEKVVIYEYSDEQKHYVREVSLME